MKPKLIFRLESRCAERVGPYMDQKFEVQCNGETLNIYQNLCEFLWNKTGNTVKHPIPSKDGIPEEELGDYMFFGFSNVEQLIKWFPEQDLMNIDKFFGNVLNFAITVYVSEDYYEGNSQVIFDRENATIVTWIEPSIIAEFDTTFSDAYANKILENFEKGMYNES